MAPEQLRVTLSGTPSDIRTIDQQAVAAHIDASTLVMGETAVAVTAQNLLLPPHVSLVKYKPIPQQTHTAAE